MVFLRMKMHYVMLFIFFCMGFTYAEFNPVMYFNQGGPIMWPLLFGSVIVVAITIERVIVLIFLKKKLKPVEFSDFMKKSLEQNGSDKLKAVDEMITFCEKKSGPVASLLVEGLVKYKESKSANLNMLETKQWMNTAIEEKGRIEIPVLEARMPIIATIANVAPLVGLFGTVIGMVAAFETMAASAGGAKPDELSGNISVALLTTAGGLLVAIPSLLIYSYLKSNMEKYILEMEEIALIMVDSIVDKND